MSDTRSLSPLVAAVIMLVAWSPAAVAQADGSATQDMVLEALHRRAAEEVVNEEARIRRRIQSAVSIFAEAAATAPRILRRERDAIVDYGAIALPEVLAAADKAVHRDVLDHLRQVVVALVPVGGSGAVAGHLQTMLAGQNAERGRFAALLLGEIDHQPAASILREAALKAPLPLVRGAAITALAWLNDPGSADLIRSGLTAPQPEVRRGALAALERHPKLVDPKLVTPLLLDSSREVILAAVSCLGAMKDSTDALKALHDFAANRDKALAMAAIDAIGRHGAKDATRRLLKDMCNDLNIDSDVRYRAARVLLDLGNDDGLEAIVAQIRRRRGRDDMATRIEVGHVFFEFGKYKAAITELEKVMNTRAEANDYRRCAETLARCYARLNNLNKAADYLSRAGTNNDWRAFRDDEDFSELRKDKRYAKYFEDS